MKTDCPQCESGETVRLYISSSVVLYLKCQICGCVFNIDPERPWSKFIVTSGHRRDPGGEGGSSAS
jgi:hypothetical protein